MVSIEESFRFRLSTINPCGAGIIDKAASCIFISVKSSSRIRATSRTVALARCSNIFIIIAANTRACSHTGRASSASTRSVSSASSATTNIHNNSRTNTTHSLYDSRRSLSQSIRHHLSDVLSCSYNSFSKILNILIEASNLRSPFIQHLLSFCITSLQIIFSLHQLS
nr:MAG TPA: hypothetical protein [Caudoviricetes sp.]